MKLKKNNVSDNTPIVYHRVNFPSYNDMMEHFIVNSTSAGFNYWLGRFKTAILADNKEEIMVITALCIRYGLLNRNLNNAIRLYHILNMQGLKFDYDSHMHRISFIHKIYVFMDGVVIGEYIMGTGDNRYRRRYSILRDVRGNPQPFTTKTLSGALKVSCWEKNWTEDDKKAIKTFSFSVRAKYRNSR